MRKSKVDRFLKLIYPYLCILGLTVVILYPQIEAHAYLAGYDAWFHMNQFYDTAMQFHTGHFSYFISLFGFGGIGRIVNAVYGPGFIYLGGLILLLAKTWYRFELIQDFLGLAFSGLFFYLLARKNYVTQLTSTLLSLLYMMSNVVMTWVINQEFNGVEAILMPLILLQGTEMVRKRRIRPITLGLTMAIAFQTHMMTTLMGTLTLIPFFLYTCDLTSKKRQLWTHLFMSIGLTALLTANVWGAMFNVLPQGLIPPVPQGLPTPNGSVTWMMKGHYFSILGFAGSITVILFVACGSLSLLLWKRSNTLYKMILITGLFVIWLSSDYFPWGWIIKIYPAFEYQIQFPKRFLSVGIGLLFLAMGMLFSHHDVHLTNHLNSFEKMTVVIVQVGLVLLVGINGMYQHSLMLHSLSEYRNVRVIDYNPFYTYRPNRRTASELRRAYHSPKDLAAGINRVHQDTPDYLPAKQSIRTYDQYRDAGLYTGLQREVYGDIKHLHPRKSAANNRLTMTWRQQHRKRTGTLPVAKYRDTQVTFNHQILKYPSVSRIGMVNVKNIRRGSNTVSISYQEPVWLHLLMWITVISWLGLIVRLIHLVYLKYGQYIPV